MCVILFIRLWITFDGYRTDELFDMRELFVHGDVSRILVLIIGTTKFFVETFFHMNCCDLTKKSTVSFYFEIKFDESI